MTTRDALPPITLGPSDAGSGPVAAARAMRDRIRALGTEIERERRLPMELVEEMRAAGFFSGKARDVSMPFAASLHADVLSTHVRKKEAELYD